MKRKLATIAVLVAVVAGCGGVENEPNLAEAAERTAALGTGRFALTGTQTTDDAPIAVRCTGAANYDAKSVRVDCEYEGSGRVQAIAIGKDVYIRGDWLAGLAPEKKWLKQTGELDDDSLATLSPERLLALLKRASSETERIGDEDVRGVETVRYRLTVTCKPAKLDCEGTALVDVWIDADGIVRRIRIDDDSGEATFEFFDFGADVFIEPPPADDVVDGDLAAGGFSSTGGGTSGGIEVTCAEGEAVPIGQRQAIAVLRRNGFQMRDAEFCIVDNSGSGGEIPTEGLVTCGIDARPRAGAPVTVTRGKGDLADTTFELRNLKCTIETGPKDRERKIARLEAAFAELERAIRP